MPETGITAHLFSYDGWVLLVYDFGPPLVRAILVALGTWICARIARSSFNFAARRADNHARALAGRVISIVIVGVGVATVLDTIGVPLTTFVTVLGVAGLGISLAMQDILKSFVAGTYLLFERPFRIGDEISVKDQRGVVEGIGVRTTLLRNADNVQIIIPNAVVFAEMVANRTNERKPEPVAADPAPAAPGTGPADGADIEGAANRSPSAAGSAPPTGAPGRPEAAPSRSITVPPAREAPDRV